MHKLFFMKGRGPAVARALHGSIAAVAAVLVSAAATVDMPSKLHLKATPILFYVVPASIPLPSLSCLCSSSTSCSGFDFDSFSPSLPSIPEKNLKHIANPSMRSLSVGVSLPPPGSCFATLCSKDVSLSSSATSQPYCQWPYLSSSSSFAQGAPMASSLPLPRRSLSCLSRASLNLNSGYFPTPQPSAISSAVKPTAFSTSSCLSFSRTPSAERHFLSAALASAAPSLHALLVPSSIEQKLLRPDFGTQSSLCAAPAHQSLSPWQPQLYPLSQFGGYEVLAFISDVSTSSSLEPFCSSLAFYHISNPASEDFLLSTSHSLHTWHIPLPSSFHLNKKDDSLVILAKKPALTVVLLGWLGAQQKHLKKYAEWYNARGIHVVTFVVPMTDVLTFKLGGKAEEHVDKLTHHLALWLNEQGADILSWQLQQLVTAIHDEGDCLLLCQRQWLLCQTKFNSCHVHFGFAGTDNDYLPTAVVEFHLQWHRYGVILEKLQERGDHLLGKIKGCVVDSAPAADPDPQVWASGFSAALLKKKSSATTTATILGEMKEGVSVEGSEKGVIWNPEVVPNGIEAALLSVLVGFFSLFLKLPAISERLSHVVTTLSKQQPQCPQLYIYSTADRVIPVKAVEAFIEQQRKAGHVVRSCNLQSSPHVDHFRSHPQLYSEQLSSFLKEVLPPTPT